LISLISETLFTEHSEEFRSEAETSCPPQAYQRELGWSEAPSDWRKFESSKSLKGLNECEEDPIEVEEHET